MHPLRLAIHVREQILNERNGLFSTVDIATKIRMAESANERRYSVSCDQQSAE
jgi:hypothetical protein